MGQKKPISVPSDLSGRRKANPALKNSLDPAGNARSHDPNQLVYTPNPPNRTGSLIHKALEFGKRLIKLGDQLLGAFEASNQIRLGKPSPFRNKQMFGPSDLITNSGAGALFRCIINFHQIPMKFNHTAVRHGRYVIRSFWLIVGRFGL